MNARGWSAYTTKGKTKADELANRMYDAAACFITGQRLGVTIRMATRIGRKILHPFQDEMPGCIDGKFLHG